MTAEQKRFNFLLSVLADRVAQASWMMEQIGIPMNHLLEIASESIAVAPGINLGWEIPNTIDRINEHLRHRKEGPPIPQDNYPNWTPDQTSSFLKMANAHFTWHPQHKTILHSHYGRWMDVARSYPELFVPPPPEDEGEDGQRPNSTPSAGRSCSPAGRCPKNSPTS